MHGRATPGSDKSAVSARVTRLSFDRYVLDLSRGCLLLDNREVFLRPKTFAVLKFLVENSGCLVSKDDIFGAVWPNLAVTDDTLVQSIGELRRELGDDGPRLIKTIPRRGYRFDASVTELAPGADATANAEPEPTASRTEAKTSNDVPTSPSAFAVVSRRRWAPVVALPLVILLAVGALLLHHSDWQLPGSLTSSGQTSKPVEANARPAIAILPFVNQGNDQARDYFADGLTQDVINALGRFSTLTVMSWNSVAPYKKNAASPEEIARSLGVRYQVEGSVLRTGTACG